uniref:Gem (nuclear organelle) associated protein 8 n=1 Tax=Paramormyrops kingsleyae TaxID=1676925 RepID=A0A3B3THC2_9TELE
MTGQYLGCSQPGTFPQRAAHVLADVSVCVTLRYPGPPQSSSDCESESEIECDVSNMEITEELRQYFTQTEQHRDPYLQANHDLHRRPGERRRVEMKKLYEEDAAKIQGMETAMQLTFHHKCDKKQPKYWPVTPLRL